MKKVDAVQAEGLIPTGAKVHTFERHRLLRWMGADVSRHKLLAAIQKNGGAAICDEAAHMDHGLVVDIEGRRTFIETIPSKVKQFRA